MTGKGTKLYSIIRFKCPHCHEGEFFVDRNPYNIAKAGDLLDTCPACGRKYEPEPGFYYGGMYVAYALAVALFVTVYLATTILWPASAIGLRVGLVLLALVLFAPLVYALSKIIWANLFLSYKGPASAPDQH
ncbi:MAG: DUF983 domain-containing protein [Flavobacteriales bacterium]|nr:DUF983 domain-containing protein [Flavobacteriales bacterium]